ncbi:MAG: glycosyltransferase family A protein [Flavobacteriaceae bacterium]|nr:glycosyltransferase family A protein [Flavobacteriaceae bacterium]
MQNQPLISVIVPCYNVEKYVAECLESIIAQTYQNLEIIVINDGSTDNTVEAIKPFLSDDRIKYIHQENKGVSEARNRGLDEIKMGG